MKLFIKYLRNKCKLNMLCGIKLSSEFLTHWEEVVKKWRSYSEYPLGITVPMPNRLTLLDALLRLLQASHNYWPSYCECLFKIAVAITNWTWVDALLVESEWVVEPLATWLWYFVKLILLFLRFIMQYCLSTRILSSCRYFLFSAEAYFIFYWC